ncbi:MAG: helix-turn-helix domain-containing protein [Gaiellaceae bacterium]
MTIDLDEVLGAVVGLLSEASAVHACFVYLLEPDADRLVLRAASEPYAHLVGAIELEKGEGLAWWSVEQREPAFIKDDALADPRFKYVSELAEERFQSLVSVPIVARDESAIGVISLHTEAPREFTEDEVEFLVSSSSLVAAAIENARLHAETRRRVRQLELLNRLGERIAGAETRDSLYGVIVAGVVELVQPAACHLYVLDSTAGLDQLARVASEPEGVADEDDVPQLIGLAELGPELGRARLSDALSHVPLMAGGELRGLLLLDGQSTGQPRTEDADIVETAASQGALALVKLELIERLREENAIGDFLEAVEAGAAAGTLETRARRLGVELSAPHVVLAASGTSASVGDWQGELERALLRRFTGALVDIRDDSVRALLPIRGEATSTDVSGRQQEIVEQLLEAVAEGVHAGLSSPCVGEEALAAGFEEALLALKGVLVLEGNARVMSHDELGAYKYLLRLSLASPERDRHRLALAELADYDRRRSAQLVQTLEEFLRHRGSISATASALYVHQNTLRQRLGRIEELTGMDLRARDWLALDIAMRLAALEQQTERVSDLAQLALER